MWPQQGVAVSLRCLFWMGSRRIQFCRYCGKFQVQLLCKNAPSAISMVNVFDIKLEADLRDTTIHLLAYFPYFEKNKVGL
jgi:hypothetical protein